MDAFDVLGLTPSFDLDLKALEQRYRDLQRALHPDRFAQAAASERRARLARAVNVNDAYRALRDEIKRAEILLARHGATVVAENQREGDPAFLMEVMELREQLAETKASGDAASRERLARGVREHQDQTIATLRATLAELPCAGKNALERATSALSRLRYYRRFLDEVALLDDAL